MLKNPVFAKFFMYTCGSSAPGKYKTAGRLLAVICVLRYTRCKTSQKRKNSAREGVLSVFTQSAVPFYPVKAASDRVSPKTAGI